MSTRLSGAAAAALTIVACLPAPLRAQSATERTAGWGRVSFGIEASATFAPADPEAFFNYTDYERDALRTGRVRFLAEWRTRPDLAFVAEARTENAGSLEAAAYYVRWSPFGREDLTVQAGRIPPILGAFPRRAYGRQRLVVGAPLAYQYLTSLRPDALPATTDDILAMRGRGWQPSFPVGSATIGPGVPLVSSTRWDTGVEVAWRRNVVELAGAVTLGSPAVPVVRETNDGRQFAGRATFTLPGGPAIGLSAARGAWVDRAALAALPANAGRQSTQRILAADAEYGRGRWLARAESVYASFDVPVATLAESPRLRAWSSFAEARWRWHPRWQTGVRVEHLDFSSLTRAGTGAAVSWDAPVRRVEAVLGFRIARRLDLVAGWQHNWRDGGRVRRRGTPVVSVVYGR